MHNLEKDRDIQLCGFVSSLSLYLERGKKFNEFLLTQQ